MSISLGIVVAIVGAAILIYGVLLKTRCSGFDTVVGVVTRCGEEYMRNPVSQKLGGARNITYGVCYEIQLPGESTPYIYKTSYPYAVRVGSTETFYMYTSNGNRNFYTDAQVIKYIKYGALFLIAGAGLAMLSYIF